MKQQDQYNDMLAKISQTNIISKYKKSQPRYFNNPNLSLDLPGADDGLPKFREALKVLPGGSDCKQLTEITILIMKQ